MSVISFDALTLSQDYVINLGYNVDNIYDEELLWPIAYPPPGSLMHAKVFYFFLYVNQVFDIVINWPCYPAMGTTVINIHLSNEKGST